jgi:trehalose-6-phosphate synthase
MFHNKEGTPVPNTAVASILLAERKRGSKPNTPQEKSEHLDVPYAYNGSLSPAPLEDMLQVQFGDLIVVSNRLPITIQKDTNGSYEYKKSSGGLVTAMTGIKGCEFKWVGWTGCECTDKHEQETLRHDLMEKYKCVPVFLNDKDADMYYSGFSNGVLWPLFHYLYEKNTVFNEEQWEAYKKVNQQFCDAILEIYKVCC